MNSKIELTPLKLIAILALIGTVLVGYNLILATKGLYDYSFFSYSSKYTEQVIKVILYWAANVTVFVISLKIILTNTDKKEAAESEFRETLTEEQKQAYDDSIWKDIGKFLKNTFPIVADQYNASKKNTK
jgi:uncharacterized membrane protein